MSDTETPTGAVNPMGEVTIDAERVRRLVSAQFPQWAHLPISRVEFDGWDNRTFHLGKRMTVRLPSAAPYALQVQKEHTWLPRLAATLPLPIPQPLAMGRPDEGYPWPWSVYRWIDGETTTPQRVGNLTKYAVDLANFLRALQRIDATDGPAPGQHNFFRGGPLTVYDEETRRAIRTLHAEIDADAATAVWDAALTATWHGSPVWFHGDISVGNLLVEEGKLGAVIDFGTSGVGDPSCDLAISWILFGAESRGAFRAALPLDDGTWARGRGWTLWKALIVAAGFMGANHPDRELSRHVIDQVLADHARAAGA